MSNATDVPHEKWYDFSWDWNYVQHFNGQSLIYYSKQDKISRFIDSGIKITNKLTIMHVKIDWGFEHATVGLECEACDPYGNPAILYVGLYPSKQSYCKYFHDDCQENMSYDWIENREYQLALEKKSSFHYDEARRVTFELDENHAELVYNYIDKVANYRIDDYRYNKISNNCIDFAQEVYRIANISDHSDHYKDHLYPRLTYTQWFMFNQPIRECIEFLEGFLYAIEDL